MFLCVLFLLCGFSPMTSDMQVAAFPSMVMALHTSMTAVKLVTDLYALGYTIGLLIYGPISDRFGRYRILLYGLVFYIVITLICAMANNMTLLLCARFLQGITACVGPNIAYAMIRDKYAGKNSAKYIAICASAVGLAVIIAPILGSLLVSIGNWRTPLIFLVLLVVVISGLAFFFCNLFSINAK